MDAVLSDRLRAEIAEELQRDRVPEGFPDLPAVPLARYTDQGFFDLEMQHVWPNSWLLIGREEDFAEAGSYRAYERLGKPLLVARGRDQKLRAFFNTCQHRGAKVVRDEQGRAMRFVCPFHSWSYDLEGKLRMVPYDRDFAPCQLEQRNLTELDCDSHDGWVFVRLNRGSQSLAEFLGPLKDEWKSMGAKSLRRIPAGSARIGCNWKIIYDAFLESYHVRVVHQRTVGSSYDHGGCTIGLLPHGHSRMVTPKTQYGRSNELGPMGDGPKEAAPASPLGMIPGLDPIYEEASLAHSLFPNLIVPGNTIGLAIIWLWPVDVRTTEVHWEWLAPPIKDAEQRAAWDMVVDQFNILMDEDFLNLESMQQSVESGALRSICLGYQERRIYHYHEAIDRLIGEERIPPELRVPEKLTAFVESSGT